MYGGYDSIGHYVQAARRRKMWKSIVKKLGDTLDYKTVDDFKKCGITDDELEFLNYPHLKVWDFFQASNRLCL